MNWVRNHKLVIVLLLVIAFLVWRQQVRQVFQLAAPSVDLSFPGEMANIGVAPSSRSSFSLPRPPQAQVPPVLKEERMVISNTSMSLVVKDVSGAVEQIKNKAKELGGYMVTSQVSNPEEGASGHITVRVPSDQVDAALTSFRGFGVRVVNENVSGQDVTDEYEDLEARLAILNGTKTKFEQLLAQSTRVEDLLNIQERLISVQSQIDAVRGQQQFLSASSQTSAITIYLSTDEFSLPYAPSQPWRPEVVFKTSVRALVQMFREIGSALIWLVVFAPVWGTLLLGIWWFTRRKR